MKNERIIVITEKSRVNKKIRRIFTNKNRIIKENVKKKRTIIAEKKRVNVKFLKYVFSLFIMCVCLLIEFFKFRARFNRFNIIYKRFKTREFFFIFEKKFTLKFLNALKVKSFTTVERVIKTEVSFKFLFLQTLLFSSDLRRGIFKIKVFFVVRDLKAFIRFYFIKSVINLQKTYVFFSFFNISVFFKFFY